MKRASLCLLRANAVALQGWGSGGSGGGGWGDGGSGGGGWGDGGGVGSASAGESGGGGWGSGGDGGSGGGGWGSGGSGGGSGGGGWGSGGSGGSGGGGWGSGGSGGSGGGGWGSGGSGGGGWGSGGSGGGGWGSGGSGGGGWGSGRGGRGRGGDGGGGGGRGGGWGSGSQWNDGDAGWRGAATGARGGRGRGSFRRGRGGGGGGFGKEGGGVWGQPSAVDEEAWSAAPPSFNPPVRRVDPLTLTAAEVEIDGIKKLVGQRVQVTGIADETTWHTLKDHLRQAGEVTFCKVFPGGRAAVEFVTPEDSARAITELQASELEGATLFLREDREDTVLINTRRKIRDARDAQLRARKEEAEQRRREQAIAEGDTPTAPEKAETAANPPS